MQGLRHIKTMSATEIFSRLREKIESSDLHLAQIARRAEVPYHKLYRFWTLGTELTLEDADNLYRTLTGKSFITLPDDNDL